MRGPKAFGAVAEDDKKFRCGGAFIDYVHILYGNKSAFIDYVYILYGNKGLQQEHRSKVPQMKIIM